MEDHNNGGTKDPSCPAEDALIAEIRSSSFREREEEYLRINAELERKTSKLMEKMEKYSRSRSNGTTLGVGDGDTDSEFGTDDNSSLWGDGDSIYNHHHRLFEETSSFRGSSSTKLRQSQSLINNSGSGGGLTLTSSSVENLTLSSKQTPPPSRLQRATQSVIKSLQAKLMNHEERLVDLHLQYRQKIQENTMSESKVRSLEEEREKLLRTIGSLQGTIERHAKVVESSKSHLSLKAQTLTSMKKEIDDLKKDKKTSNSSVHSLQTRLHRSLEEVERLKQQNKSLNFHLREIQGDYRSKVDESTSKIADLEKQNSFLNSTIRKQANMIKELQEQRVQAQRTRSHHSLRLD